MKLILQGEEGPLGPEGPTGMTGERVCTHRHTYVVVCQQGCKMLYGELSGLVKQLKKAGKCLFVEKCLLRWTDYSYYNISHDIFIFSGNSSN